MLVKELWVYPIKGCQGVALDRCEFNANGGFEHDRVFAVVDIEGTRYAEREALSPRKIPALLTISVEVDAKCKGDPWICLNAPGMDELKVPMNEEHYRGPRK
mmetsp:Transcript_20704/g.34170  ORF Transcript_20704/g.34170 Transcript_20704/m.34170 type:complete len:102 (-) Transcript_20704:1056-1361(-)